MDSKSKLNVLETGREIYFAAIIAIANEPVTKKHRNYHILHAEYDQMQKMLHVLKEWSLVYEAEVKRRED